MCCNAYSVNEKDQKKIYLDYSKKTIDFPDLIKINYVILSSAVIHRSLLVECCGFPEGANFKNAPDYALWLRITTQTDFSYLDEVLVNYLDEPGKSIRRFNRNPFRQKRLILKNFLNWSKNHTQLKSYRDKVKQQLYLLVKSYENYFLYL